jgi:hypothetical protein
MGCGNMLYSLISPWKAYSELEINMQEFYEKCSQAQNLWECDGKETGLDGRRSWTVIVIRKSSANPIVSSEAGVAL